MACKIKTPGLFSEFGITLNQLPILFKKNISWMYYKQNSICFQTEQVSVPIKLKKFINSLETKKKILVLDYSLENTNILKSFFSNSDEYKNVSVIYTPILYFKHTLYSIPTNREFQYDVGVIFGVETPRRKHIIDELSKLGIKIYNIKEWNIEKKIHELIKCKILLNIHASPQYKVFEFARCTLPILHNIPVISEVSNIEVELQNQFTQELLKHVIFSEYNDIISKVLHFLESPKYTSIDIQRIEKQSNTEIVRIKNELEEYFSTLN